MSVNIENFETIFGIKNNIQTLRNQVLELAIQGRLTSDFMITEQGNKILSKLIEESKFKQTGKKCEHIPLNAPERKKYPANWDVFKIGDVFQLINGRAFKPSEWFLSGLPIIRIQNLNNNNAPFNYCNFEVEDKFIVNSNDILIGWSGTPGTSFGAFVWKKGKGVLNQHIFKAIPYFEMNKEFLKYSINSKLNEMIRKAHGGVGLQHITKGEFEEIIIPIPSLEEQDLIVTKIESLMFEIDKLEESLQNKEHLMELMPKALIDVIGNCKTGEELKEQLQFAIDNFEVIFQTPDSMQELRNVVLQLAVEGKLVPQDTADESTSELVKRIQVEKNRLVNEGKIKKQKALETIDKIEIPFDIPKSWKWVRLGTIITFQGGYAYKSNSYIENSRYQIIRLGNVKNDKILINTSPVYIPNNIAFATMNYKISEGDILVTMTGTKNKRDYFYTCRVCEEDLYSKELFSNQRVGILKSDKEINSHYINLMLKAESTLKSIFATETGTANQGNIGSSSIENLIIPLPPVNEQHRIVKKVESIMSLIEQMEFGLKRKVDLVEKLADI